MELQDLSTSFDHPKGLARVIGGESDETSRDRLKQRELTLVARALEQAQDELRLEGRTEVPVAPVTITSKDPDAGIVETSDGRKFQVGWIPQTAFDNYRWATARATEITDGNIEPLVIEADSPSVNGGDVNPDESTIALENLWPRMEETLTARRWEDENVVTVRIPELGEVRLPVSGDPVYVRADSGRYVSFIRQSDFPARPDETVGEGAGIKLVGFELIKPEVSAGTVASDCWSEQIALTAPAPQAPQISSLEEAPAPAQTIESARPELSL